MRGVLQRHIDSIAHLIRHIVTLNIRQLLYALLMKFNRVHLIHRCNLRKDDWEMLVDIIQTAERRRVGEILRMRCIKHHTNDTDKLCILRRFNSPLITLIERAQQAVKTRGLFSRVMSPRNTVTLGTVLIRSKRNNVDWKVCPNTLTRCENRYILNVLGIHQHIAPGIRTVGQFKQQRVIQEAANSIGHCEV